MAKKERKQDLAGPEEEALEQHVREMLDVNEPEPTPEKAVDSEANPEKTKSVSIKITHDDEPDSQPAKDEALDAAISETNQQLAEEVSTAPLVDKKEASKKPKKVEIIHHESSPIDEPESKEPIPEPTLPEPNSNEETEIETAEDQPTAPLLSASVNEPAEAETTQQKNTEEVDTSKPVGELMDESSPLETVIESPETDKAVSEIIANEGDQLLAVQDSDQQSDSGATKPRKDSKKSPSLLSLIVRSPSFRWTLFIIIVLSLVGAGAYPKSRYFALNKAGVRSHASITITDQSTLRPLKNVKVTLAGQTVTSDQDGKAIFSKLMLGPSSLLIEKRAYATEKREVTVGWGSNPLGDISLTPQGVQYVFQVNDILSGKPIADVEASVGELSATANEKGEIKLALDDIDVEEVDVKFVAGGYKNLNHKLVLANKEPSNITLTPSRQVAFVSKRTGTYDLYKIDIDGQNETLLLKGTGNESSDIGLFQHPTDDIVLLLSTRNGEYGAEGALKRSLILVNLKDSSTKTVISSSQIKAIEWVGSRLVYVMIDDQAGQDSTARYKLMSYDYKSGDNRQLATANYFNSVTPVGGRIFYAPAGAHANGINIGVFAVHADGSGKEVILDKEAWNMFQTTRDSITIAVQQEWYSLSKGDKPKKLGGQPSEAISRVYVDSPDGKFSTWLDNRDGKGTVVLYDIGKNTEDVLLSENGVSGPIRWLNSSSFVYRVANNRETADYAVSINGGSPIKITDVTSTNGINRWAY